MTRTLSCLTLALASLAGGGVAADAQALLFKWEIGIETEVTILLRIYDDAGTILYPVSGDDCEEWEDAYCQVNPVNSAGIDWSGDLDGNCDCDWTFSWDSETTRFLTLEFARETASAPNVIRRYVYAPSSTRLRGTFWIPDGNLDSPDILFDVELQSTEYVVRATTRGHASPEPFFEGELGQNYVIPYQSASYCPQAGCNAEDIEFFLSPVAQVPTGTPLEFVMSDAAAEFMADWTGTWTDPDLTLLFPTGSRMFVRGSLTASDVTFTRTGSQSTWGGIVVAGSNGQLTLNGGSVVEHAYAGVTVYEPARAIISGGATTLRDNDIGLVVLSNAGGGVNPGALVEDAQVLDNGTGIRTDYTCTWNSGSSPICESEEVLPTRSRVWLDGARVASNAGIGLYALNGNARIDAACLEDNGGNGITVANGTVAPVSLTTVKDNGVTSDGYGASVLASGSLQLSDTEDWGRNRFMTNATSELWVWQGGTLFLGESSASGQNRVSDSGSLIFAANSSVHVDARRTYWTGGPAPGAAFPGPGSVDALDHRTSDATSDVCNASIGGGSDQIASLPPASTAGFGIEEHRQELVRVRLLAEQMLGTPEAARHVRALATLQRADHRDSLGERTASLAALARVRQRLDRSLIAAEVRMAAEAALEAEVMEALEREDYAGADDLMEEYEPRVLGIDVGRSLTMARAHLAAQRGRRAEAAILVESVANEIDDPAARGELLILALALAQEHGLSRAGSSEAGGSATVGTFAVQHGIGVAPNPITGNATIRIVLEDDSHVTLDVLDVLGRVVHRLADDALDAGPQAYSLSLSGFPAGMYLVRLVVESNGARHVQLARATVVR